MRDFAELEAATVERLLELGGEDFLLHLLDLLAEIAPQRLDELRRALDGGDLAAARSAAHALRSTAGTVGAARLLDGCRRVEEAPGLAAALAAAAELESEWRRLRERLGH